MVRQKNLAIIEIGIKEDRLDLTVNIDGKEKVLKFNSHWLRFNCQSEKSRETSTGQRTIPIKSIPSSLKIKSVKHEGENIVIEWDESANQGDTIISVNFLLKNNPSAEMFLSDKHYGTFKNLSFFNYKDFFDLNGNKNEENVFKWIKNLTEYGLCIVKNVQTQENMIKNLVELIAPLEKTIYDEIFDVKVDDNPSNLANSTAPLEFHNDLVYYESPPGIQFLHCLKFDQSIIGGETLFVDAFEVAEKFRQKNPRLFDVLVRIPGSFQKIHNYKGRKVFIFHSKPHIVLNHRQKIIGINWGPANEAPLKNLTEEEIKQYYEAYLEFYKAINDESNRISYRLNPGEVVCFNNRRFLHSRNGFIQPRGARHFQGCYLNMDEFKSEVLAREFLMDNKNTDKVINQSLDISDSELINTNVGKNDYN